MAHETLSLNTIIKHYLKIGLQPSKIFPIRIWSHETFQSDLKGDDLSISIVHHIYITVKIQNIRDLEKFFIFSCTVIIKINMLLL